MVAVGIGVLYDGGHSQFLSAPGFIAVDIQRRCCLALSSYSCIGMLSLDTKQPYQPCRFIVAVGCCALDAGRSLLPVTTSGACA